MIEIHIASLSLKVVSFTSLHIGDPAFFAMEDEDLIDFEEARPAGLNSLRLPALKCKAFNGF
jgi:hypothetical protein